VLTFLVSVILIIGAIGLAIVSRCFRWVFAAFVVLVLAVILHFVNADSERKREAEESKGRIPMSQVQFENMTMDGFQSYSRITGRVRNSSPNYSIVGSELEVFVQDCSSDNNCETVGQTTVTSRSMNIPPMQTRAFDESAYFSSLPAAKGKYRWNYRIVYIQGATPRSQD
jgi:hypothetical protein